MTKTNLNAFDIFRALYESITDPAYLVELNDDNTPKFFRSANKAACELLGYSRDELMNMAPANIGTPNSNEAFIRIHFNKLLDAGHAQFESVHRHKSGKEIEVEVNVHLFSTENNRYIFISARDLSAKKKLERDLRKNEELFRIILENAYDGIILADGETKKMLMANDAFCKMLGYELIEIPQLTVEDLHPKEDLPRIVEIHE